MAGILMFATLVLTYMAIWMQKQAKSQVGAMTARIDAAIDGGNLFGLVLLAFLAVMREGFETVLFFSALVYSGQGVDLHEGLVGALAGLLVSVVLVWGCCAPPARWRWPLLPLDRPAHHHHRRGLLSSAVNMLQAADVITFWTTPVFNISHVLDDQGSSAPSCAPCLVTMPRRPACSC